MSTATRKLSDFEREVYGCPEWCERWDHDTEESDSIEEVCHFGPDFGDVLVSAMGDAVPTARIDYDSWSEIGPTELRKLAADALAAAAWLEDHGA